MNDIPRPFFEHLEELRVRLLKAVVSTAIATAVVYYGVDGILQFLAKPVGRFIFLEATEAFFVRLKVSLAAGFLLSLPVWIYQLWQFLVIAFTPKEKRAFIWVLPTSYILFLMGFSFGFFVLVPIGVKFLLGYGGPLMQPAISIDRYVDFVGTLCLVLGAVFQMPLVTFFLAKVGVIRAQTLSDKRRVAVLVIYIVSALATPGPDPVTAFLLAVPTYLLYETSILLARLAVRP